MESANIHHDHHLHQDQLNIVSSSSLATTTTSSCYGGTTSSSTTTTHDQNAAANWSSSTPISSSFLNTINSFTTSYPINEANILMNPRQHHQDHNNNTLVLSSQYTSNIMSPHPDFTFHNWANDHDHHQDLHLSRIKDELSENNYYLKYTDLLNTTSTPSSRTTQHLHHDLQPNEDVVGGTKLLLKSASAGNLMNTKHIGDMNLYSNSSSSGNSYGGGNNGRLGFSSQIFPSVNVSGMNQQAGLNNNPVGSLDMNLEALDLLTSSRFSGGGANYFGPASSQNQMEMLRDGLSYGFDHMHQLYSSNKINSAASSNNTGSVAEAKRSSSKMEPKPLQTAPKKSRLEARASCPPFKVRKEKLGDRIASLQQLVAPFGKTDTASVLMEAIGYIKFLQNQVETLSVPYMKSSRNKANPRVIKGGTAPENENEEQKRDLKSRGLCLVPLTCLSYITDGGGAAVWPPPHFGGAT